jgi:hypothetical protein
MALENEKFDNPDTQYFGRFGLEVDWLRLSPKAKPMVRRGAVDLGHSPPLALPNGVGKSRWWWFEIKRHLT